jgi:HlyD family secretion protein
LKQQEKELELSTIKAPVAGQILKIHANPGEAINTETGIAEIGQTAQMMVVAEVYESDITKVKIGQEVEMTSESGAFDTPLKGKVREIGWQVGKKDVLDSDPAADVDVRIIEVKIQLDSASSRIVSNLTYGKVIVKIFMD